ncbi:MAG: agmatine deiminase [Saprospiraceae bacterium]|jgi:agmatine deiminase
MKTFLYKYIALGLLFATTIVSAQLPKGFTDAEKQIIADYQFTKYTMTPPPSVPVRAAAEWEEIEYLVITWENNYDGILTQIVAAGIQECKVVITTQNPNAVTNTLTNAGIDLTNVIFMDRNWDSIWIRDYAGNTIYENEVGDRALTDWIYNRPRPNDDTVPFGHAMLLEIPLYVTDTAPNDLVNTGGNYMSDGLGNAFASELILEENEPGNPYNVSAKTEAQIDQIMEDYMGIQNYIKMPALPYDVINHIDMHMKLIDEQTLVVSRYPEGVADGPQIEANIQEVLDNEVSAFGSPYKINWIDAPPSTSGAYPDNGGYYRTYTNAVFVNKTILVPTYRPNVDNSALAQWRDLMPGYNVVGIDVDNSGENLIASLGAIHCITHSIGVADPLWIVHQAIPSAQENTSLTIEASIKHNSGIANASVFYRDLGTSTYQEVPMSLTSNDIWSSDITVQTTNIEYYIWAQAISGKTLTRPIVAPEGYWTMQVGELGATVYDLQTITGPFPNPASKSVSFKFKDVEGTLKVTITNILGQELYNKQVTQPNGTLTLQLQDSWRGALFATFTGQFGSTTKKIIKL